MKVWARNWEHQALWKSFLLRSGGYSRNETPTPQTSRKVHYSSLLHVYPPQHHQQGQYQAPRFSSLTKAPRALSSPGRKEISGTQRRRSTRDPPSSRAALRGGILSGGSWCPLGPPKGFRTIHLRRKECRRAPHLTHCACSRPPPLRKSLDLAQRPPWLRAWEKLELARSVVAE